VALVLASNAPDIDIVTVARGTESYLKWHRGPTHGPLGIIGLGIVTAALVFFGQRAYDNWRASRKDPPPPSSDNNASFQMLVALSILGALLHVAMDLPTQYGTRIFSPFDWHWYGIDLMPIVDVYLLAALLSGLAFGARSVEARQRNASIVLIMMTANYGLRVVTHSQALDTVPRLFGPTLAAPCDPQHANERRAVDVWPRSQPISLPESGRRCLVELAAMPTFISPFRWQIIAQVSNAYELRDVDLLEMRSRDPEDDSEAPWRTTIRYPNVWTPTVTQAANTDLGRLFLGFSRFPAARSAIGPHGVTTVRWTDVRFVSGAAAAFEQRRPGPSFFTATVAVGADGRILQERLGR